MPMSYAFQTRLFPILSKIVEEFGTPFHIYDEMGIVGTSQRIKRVFSEIEGFKEFFAVKALPNPAVLKIERDMGFGFDCSSIPEIRLVRERVGVNNSEDIFFSSNNTSTEEFKEALRDGSCILNLDDITMVEKFSRMPKLICFRYNPGPNWRGGSNFIGDPVEAKYGVRDDQIVKAYQLAINRGAERFGIHTMVGSNQLDYAYFIRVVKMLLEVIERISDQLKIQFEFINMGGGLGIPYHPDEKSLDIEKVAAGIKMLFNNFRKHFGYPPKLFMESGRYMTGPHGVLVTRVLNRMHKYRQYVGVDASMSALPRPAMYEAYHHIIVFRMEGYPGKEIVDVVGSLCENNDKFAIQRELPITSEGDIIIIQDTGAHSHAMGFNYNGRLRPQELLLRADGSVERIRRAETYEDYIATLTPPHLKPKIVKFD